MSKSSILQVGLYPEWDQGPLDQTFDVNRLFEAQDKDAFLADMAQPFAGLRRAVNWVPTQP